MGGERLCLFCISFIMKNRRRVWIWGIYSLLPTHTQTGHINTTKNETYVKKSLCTDKKTWPGHAPEAPPFLLKSNISDVTTSSHVLTSRLADPRWALLIGIIWIWQENPGWQKQHPVFPLCPLPCNPPPPAVPALRLYFFSHQYFNISLWHTAFCFHWCLSSPPCADQFPSLQSKMRVVLRVEVEAVKFLKEEPHRLDALLKRCNTMTDALSTLRRYSN